MHRLAAVLAVLAVLVLAPLASAQSDSCATPTPIQGWGSTPFSTVDATSDGILQTGCGGGQPYRDVWFCWTAPASGIAEASLCGSTTFDTVMAVYAGCACPAAGSALGCNDDSTGCTCAYYPSDSWFDVSACLNALESAILSFGIQIITAEIDDLHLKETGLGFRSLGQTWECDHLVLAAGASSLLMLEKMGFRTPRHFLIAGQSLSFDFESGKSERVLVKGNLSLAHCFNRMILGSSSWQAFDRNYSIEDDRRQLLQLSGAAFGLNEKLLIRSTWQSRQGVRLRVGDRMPILGIWPEAQMKGRLSILSGFYKNGLQLADLCAEQLVRDMSGEKLDEFGRGFHIKRLLPSSHP